MSRPNHAARDNGGTLPISAEIVIDLAEELSRDIRTEHAQRYDIESFRRRIEHGKPDGLRPYTEVELTQNRAYLAEAVAKHAALCRRIGFVGGRLIAAGEERGLRPREGAQHPLDALRENLGKTGCHSEGICIDAVQFLQHLAAVAWLERCPGKPLEFLKGVEGDIDRLPAAEERCLEMGLQGASGGDAAAARDAIRRRVRESAPAVSSLAGWPGVNTSTRDFADLLRQWDTRPTLRSTADELHGARMNLLRIRADICNPKVAESLARHGWRSDGHPVERPDTPDVLIADLQVERDVLGVIDQGPYGVDGRLMAKKLRSYQQRAGRFCGAAEVPDVWPGDTITVAHALAEVVKLLKWCEGRRSTSDLTGAGGADAVRAARLAAPAPVKKLAPPSRERAFSQYLEAINADPRLEAAGTKAIYESVKRRASGTGGKLPRPTTWARYVREARRMREPSADRNGQSAE